MMFIMSVTAYVIYMFTPSWLSGKLGGFALLLPVMRILISKSWYIFPLCAFISFLIGGWLVVLTGCNNNKKMWLWICVGLNIISIIL